jgi:hypothetical protein
MVIVLCFIFLNLTAQSQYGLTTGSYAGLHQLQVNPANICFQPITYEINIASVDAYINNNDFYANSTFVPQLFFNDNFTKLRLKNHRYTPDSLMQGNLLLNRNLQSNGYVFGGVNMMGPSILFAISRKKSMAFTTGFRTNLSATGISPLTAMVIFEGASFALATNSKIEKTDTKIVIASWSEIGISYAQVINDNKNFTDRIGISVKALIGIMGGYVNYNGFSGLNKSVLELDIQNASFNYAFAGPSNENKLKKISTNDFATRGLGASFDFGYSIQKNTIAGTRYCPNLYEYGNNTKSYKWKAGVSLLDIGAIKYFTNTFVTNIKNNDLFLNDLDSLVDNNIKAINASLKVGLNPKDVETANNFWLFLPSAVSAQFDYNFTNSFFVNANIFQRITLVKTPSMSRMNSLAIVPRYETEQMSVFMPIVLNEYKNFNLGLALRYKFITIGSDRFGETFGFQNLYGANIYAAIKYSFINKRRIWKKLY